jgi:hypothetical protein|tara:strand:+ start:679 stop:936 length:258 start_codon:yes stop_codon:yes gene_type:complete
MKDKRTYDKFKDYSNDISYENEFKYSINEDRGASDLTLQIEMLIKQKELLQFKCREAAGKIQGLTKEIDRLSEENDNLKTMIGKL